MRLCMGMWNLLQICVDVDGHEDDDAGSDLELDLDRGSDMFRCVYRDVGAVADVDAGVGVDVDMVVCVYVDVELDLDVGPDLGQGLDPHLDHVMCVVAVWRCGRWRGRGC